MSFLTIVMMRQWRWWNLSTNALAVGIVLMAGGDGNYGGESIGDNNGCKIGDGYYVDGGGKRSGGSTKYDRRCMAVKHGGLQQRC